MRNLLSDLPPSAVNELFETLARAGQTRIERIVSLGHHSPDDFWYDQADHEFVLVIRGAAKLRFEDDDEPVAMAPGDCLTIPAGRRHRVDWTTPNEPTVWLAVFFSGELERMA